MEHIYVQRTMGKLGAYNTVKYTAPFEYPVFWLAAFSKVGMNRDIAFFFQQLSTLKHLPIVSFYFSCFLEPIVEIKASVDISIASWYKGTPMPMICIAKQSDYEKEKLHVS